MARKGQVGGNSVGLSSARRIQRAALEAAFAPGDDDRPTALDKFPAPPSLNGDERDLWNLLLQDVDGDEFRAADLPLLHVYIQTQLQLAALSEKLKGADTWLVSPTTGALYAHPGFSQLNSLRRLMVQQAGQLRLAPNNHRPMGLEPGENPTDRAKDTRPDAAQSGRTALLFGRAIGFDDAEAA